MIKLFIAYEWIFILFLIFSAAALAAEKNAHQTESDQLIDSVWIWEVKTKKSVILIAGELHDHVLSSHENLSHQLAETAQDVSSRIFLERIFTKRFTKNPLRDRIDEKSWALLSEAIRQSVREKQKQTNFLGNINVDVAANKILEFVNRIPSHLLLSEVSLLLAPVKGANERSEKGFLMRISTDKDATAFKKNEFLEPNDAIEKVWSSNCADPKNDQNIIDFLLKQVGYGLESANDTVRKYFFEFRRKNATASSLNSISELSEAWKIEHRCHVASRNIDWMKVLKPVIDESSEPIMIVAGIGHVVGEKGLLALLCAEGHCDFKRLLTVEEIARSASKKDAPTR